MESFGNQQQMINQSIEDLSQYSMDNQSQIDFPKDDVVSNNQDGASSYNDISSAVSGTGGRGGQSPLVFVFGQNSYGELGLGDTNERNAPAQVKFFDDLNISQIAAGNEHIAVLTRAGEVFTVGFNGSGQLGHGNNKSISQPKKIEALKNIKITQLSSANGCESLALISNEGKLFTCGYNNYGQLGHGTQSNLSTPTLVNAIREQQVLNVSCSYYHSIVVTQERDAQGPNKQQTQVYSVGRNDNGQLGQEHTIHEVTPKIIRSLSTRSVIQTACGLHHSVFVTLNGEVFSCGFNDNGQLGHSDIRSRNAPVLIEALRNKFIAQAACGYYHTIVRRETGEIYAFGRNDKGQLGIETNGLAQTQPKLISEFLSVSVIYPQGNYGGSQIILGLGNQNQPAISSRMDDPSTIPLPDASSSPPQQHQVAQYISKRVNISKIACGCYHSIALDESGHVYTLNI